MRFAQPERQMTTLIDIRVAPSDGKTRPGSGGTVGAYRDRLEPGPFARRCPECGRVDHSDSELAGTCETCPGLVPLVAA